MMASEQKVTRSGFSPKYVLTEYLMSHIERGADSSHSLISISVHRIPWVPEVPVHIAG